MTTQISGTTGVNQVQPGSVTQAGLAANVAGNGAAFDAYSTTPQSIPNTTTTKVVLQAENFDTANAFDSVTNSRFQPTVAGYYSISFGVNLSAPALALYATIFKNGAIAKRGGVSGSATNSGYGSSGSALVYLNGSTDYLELYVAQGSGAPINTLTGSEMTYLSGFLARAA